MVIILGSHLGDPGLSPGVGILLRLIFCACFFFVQISVSVSMLEIYNDEIRDLLRKDPNSREKMDVRQTPEGGSYVPNLTIVSLKTLDEAFRVNPLCKHLI